MEIILQFSMPLFFLLAGGFGFLAYNDPKFAKIVIQAFGNAFVLLYLFYAIYCIGMLQSVSNSQNTVIKELDKLNQGEKSEAYRNFIINIASDINKATLPWQQQRDYAEMSVYIIICVCIALYIFANMREAHMNEQCDKIYNKPENSSL